MTSQHLFKILSVVITKFLKKNFSGQIKLNTIVNYINYTKFDGFMFFFFFFILVAL